MPLMAITEKGRQVRDEALRLKLAGCTYAAIGRQLGLSRQRIQQLLRPPAAIVKLVCKKAGDRCENCGILIGSGGHIHHVGGKDGEWNDASQLRLLCIRCHGLEHREQMAERYR